ncbi:MAG: hypothetical protein RLZZ312_974 [Bacteroidota bacterium]|jgi:hypothetical protein
MPQKTTSPYDILGISSATICMIHCIVFPVLTIVPLGLLNDVCVDSAFAFIGLLVVSKVLMSGATLLVKGILGISILIILITVTAHILFEKESPLFLVGGLGMILGHILNYKNHFKKNIVS